PDHSRCYACSNGGTGRSKGRDRSETSDKDYVQNEIEGRHYDAEDHRRLSVARRTQCPAGHKVDEEAKTEDKCYTQKRQRLRLDAGVGTYKIKKIWSDKISDRGHYADGQNDRREKGLINGAVYLFLVMRPGKTRDE